MSKLRQLDIADIASRVYDIFDMTIKDKCGPYKWAPANIGVNCDDLRLKINSAEEYWRTDGKYVRLGSHITFYCFDEDDIEERTQLNNVLSTVRSKLYPGKMTIEQFLKEVGEHSESWTEHKKKAAIKYYKEIFSSIDSDQPYVKGKYVLFRSTYKAPIKQAQLMSDFRKAVLDLLGLPYAKYISTTTPMCNMMYSFEHAGFLNFMLSDDIKSPCRDILTESDLARLDERWEKSFRRAKEIEKEGGKHNITVDRYHRQRDIISADWPYSERRLMLVELLQESDGKPPSFDVEEFEKLASLIRDYGLRIDIVYLGKNPNKGLRDASLDELSEYLNVG